MHNATTRMFIILVGQEYNYLIDGGRRKDTAFSNIECCLREYDVMNEDGVKLHGIIVTHPDGDHLNGIVKLLEKYGQKILNSYNIVITEAFFWIGEKGKTNAEVSKLMVQIRNVYLTRDVIVKTRCLRAGFNCYFRNVSGCLFGCACMPKADKSISTHLSEPKQKPKGIDANETSILTTINESKRRCDAVLTGDSNFKEILPLVEGKEIGIFQVPHHGSWEQYGLSTKHDEEAKIQKIAQFYCKFTAQCYLISAGGTKNYKHPHPPVLQGIILANSRQSNTCVILLTNSRGLDSKKVKQLHKLVPQWTKYVNIYHYDDVFCTEPEQCHTNLHPERCISDISKSTIQWTPEGYVNNITRIMLPVEPTMGACRPLAKNRFVEKSTVGITIEGTFSFKAHIICVPLPHNPRSGDSINCCYVIEESIAPGNHFSQALFLVDNDASTQSLSRAKKYILFQYINNEWQKKELPATVQDICIPQTSPCRIPYGKINSLWSSDEEAADTTASRSTGVLHNREKAKEQRPSFVQDGRCNEDRQSKDTPESEKKAEDKTECPTKGCGCKTGCATNRCGCKRRGLPCGPSCKCSDCKNNQLKTFYQPKETTPASELLDEEIEKGGEEKNMDNARLTTGEVSGTLF